MYSLSLTFLLVLAANFSYVRCLSGPRTPELLHWDESKVDERDCLLRLREKAQLIASTASAVQDARLITSDRRRTRHQLTRQKRSGPSSIDKPPSIQHLQAALQDLKAVNEELLSFSPTTMLISAKALGTESNQSQVPDSDLPAYETAPEGSRESVWPADVFDVDYPEQNDTIVMEPELSALYRQERNLTELIAAHNESLVREMVLLKGLEVKAALHHVKQDAKYEEMVNARAQVTTANESVISLIISIDSAEHRSFEYCNATKPAALELTSTELLYQQTDRKYQHMVAEGADDKLKNFTASKEEELEVRRALFKADLWTKYADYKINETSGTLQEEIDELNDFNAELKDVPEADSSVTFCQNDSATWDAGYGGCSTYAQGESNHAYCKDDGAAEVCIQCGCVQAQNDVAEDLQKQAVVVADATDEFDDAKGMFDRATEAHADRAVELNQSMAATNQSAVGLLDHQKELNKWGNYTAKLGNASEAAETRLQQLHVWCDTAQQEERELRLMYPEHEAVLHNTSATAEGQHYLSAKATAASADSNVTAQKAVVEAEKSVLEELHTELDELRVELDGRSSNINYTARKPRDDALPRLALLLGIGVVLVATMVCVARS